MWEEAGQVLERTRMYAVTMQDALLHICDMRYVSASVEFHGLTEALRILDTGDFDWGSQSSPVLPCIEKVFQEQVLKDLRGIFATARQCLAQNVQHEWKMQVKLLLPQSEHFSVPWKLLAALIGQNCSEVMLPLQFQALPNTKQGRDAIKELQVVCENLAPVFEQCLKVACVKGVNEMTFLLSWQALARFRVHVCKLMAVLFCVVSARWNPSRRVR